MDETQMLRDIITKQKEVVDTARVFIGNYRGMRDHSMTCFVCRIQEPTEATCMFGYTLRNVTQTYVKMLDYKLNVLDGKKEEKVEQNEPNAN